MLSICPYICQSITALQFLLFILQNSLGNLFIFCINGDIDEMLLLEKNKGLGINSFRVISFHYSLKVALAWLYIVHAG